VGREGEGTTRESRCGDHEICEIFKGMYSPPVGKHFDELGWLSFEDRLSDRPPADPNVDAMSVVDSSQDLLPRPHWAPASYPQLPVPKPSSPLALDSNWVHSMTAAASGDSFSRESSINTQLPRAQQGNDLFGCKHSALPIRSSLHSTVSLPPQRARFIDEL